MDHFHESKCDFVLVWFSVSCRNLICKFQQASLVQIKKKKKKTGYGGKMNVMDSKNH